MMSRIAGLISISMLSGCILICGVYAAGQQNAASQSKPVSAAKPRVAQSAPGPRDKVVNQLAQVQEQLKQLQTSIEAMRSEQQSIKVGLESTVRLTVQNSRDSAEVIHALAENRKVIDLLDRQLQVANNYDDHIATGVGFLLERTNTLPGDLRQIKTKLGLY